MISRKMKIDAEKTGAELLGLREGVTDTSTLIYLEEIHLLQKAIDCFQLLLPTGVVAEFGRCPAGCIVCGEKESRITDLAVVELAASRYLPVFSEDRQILRASAGVGLKYYNTLMLLLSLLLQNKIDISGYKKAHTCLQKTARYSPAVWQAGEKVFSLYVR
ncbi:MAG: hypothetical protein DSY58_07555 [Desulfobulbus sp.]|nr:MAG: hypothetical protein DSY58_07555 [Desulfobulbus sp.]